MGGGGVDEEVVPGAGEGAAAAEAVPLALRAPGSVAEHQLQGEGVLVAEAVITEIDTVRSSFSLESQVSMVHLSIRPYNKIQPGGNQCI